MIIKQLYIFCFTLLSVVAVAQQNYPLPVKTIRLDSTTEIGKAEIKEIGKDEGSIISVDGKLELKFPAGALSKKKKITIQPIH